MMDHQQNVLDTLIEYFKKNTTHLAESELRIPVEHFTDEQRAADERAVMRRKPLVVAHHSEIPQPGSFITRDVLGTPLLIVRQKDMGVRASINVCRHRGGTVESEPCGKKRVFTCNYHGWTYDRDGSLRHIPYAQFFEPLDRVSHGLTQAHVEERHGMIWVTLEPEENPVSVADYLGEEMESRLAEFNYDKSLLVMEKQFTLNVNWKLVIDGAVDSLHPKFLHPYGVGKLISTNTCVVETHGLHMQSFTPRMRLEQKVEAGEEHEVEGFYKHVGSSLFMFPNVTAAITPDHVEFWTTWPSLDNPSECTIVIRFLADPDTYDERMEARINKSWEILQQAALEEDFPMEETIQQNSLSTPGGEYIYGRNEAGPQHLHRQLAKELSPALADA
jgi:phenylpropionate dioxygenase-like ring-hydroxylating dioxygenase large terminal subunit